MRRLLVARSLLPAVVFALAVTLALAFAGPARASDYLTEAANALAHSRLYAPNVPPTVTGPIQGQLDPNGNIAVVILPAAAATDGTAQDFANRLDAATHHQYVLVVLVGNNVVDASQLIPSGELTTELTHAQSNGTNPPETATTLMLYLQDWMKANPDQVKQPPPPPPSPPAPGQSAPAHHSGGPLLIFLLAMIVIVAALALVLVTKRSRKQNLAKGLPMRSNARHRIETAQQTIEQIEELTEQLNNRPNQVQAVKDLNDGCKAARDLLRLVVKKAPDSIESKTSQLYNQSLAYVLEMLKIYLNLLDQPDYYGTRREITTLSDQGRAAFRTMGEFAIRVIREINRGDVDAYRRALEGMQQPETPNFFHD